MRTYAFALIAALGVAIHLENEATEVVCDDDGNCWETDGEDGDCEDCYWIEIFNGASFKDLVDGFNGFSSPEDVEMLFNALDADGVLTEEER